MITKEQLIKMNGYGTLHCTIRQECKKIVGPRGGVKEVCDHVRLSGQCKTWKRDTERFRQPVKYGMYESFYIEPSNAADFHFPDDCPAECF